MTGLPENWEWDYDGRRWFYRYKPTGLIQYTFPKPGDEFPEFICDTEEPLDLAPEERLVSQQQIKRRSTLSESQAKQKTATTAQRDRSSSNAVSDSDDGDGPFWLQPDGLMYMGPGAYNDISPLQEEEEGEERGQSEDKTDDKQDVASQTATPPVSSAAATATATTASKVTAGEDAAQPPRSHASPTASADNTPHVVNSLPATTTPELDSVPVTIAPTQQQPAESAVQPAQLPEIPLLDGREVPYDPTGVVAELASESTAQCAEEINPAPVELPSNETMMGNAGPGPASYVNAFHLAPVELPSNEITPARAAGSCAIKQQTLQQEEQVQQQNTQQAAQHLPSRPYMPLRQNSLPQVATTQISNRVPTLTPGKYQPYNPAKPAVLGAATATRQPSAEAQTGQLVGDNKRHSLSGPVLWQTQPSNIPPPLRPDAVQSSGASSNGAQPTFPSARPRFDSTPGFPAAETPSGLTHVPSVLKPARGRPIIRTQSPPQSQGVSPARIHQAYKPSRDLQREIEDTVQLLSKTGYGQETAIPEASGSARPQPSRTSTLPACLPALPYMGARPHLPHSATSEPVTLQSPDAQQPAPHEITSAVSSGATGVPISFECATPLSPSNSAVPPPLRLSRKSPPLGTDAPSIASPPTITSPPVIASSVVAAGATDKGGGPCEQPGATVQIDIPVSSGQPHFKSSPGLRQDTDQVAASATQPSRFPKTSSEQVASSGCGAVTESTSSPAPRAAVPTQQTVPQSATSDHDHRPPPQPNATLPTDENAEGQISPPPAASPAPPSGSVHASDNFASKPGSQQAAAPVAPSATPRPPSPGTPSPVSRASSPPTRSNTSRALPSVRASSDQNSNQAPVVGGGTCTKDPLPPAPSDKSVLSSTSEYAISPGHHPLASHPVSVLARSPPPESGPSDASKVAPTVSPEGAATVKARSDASSPSLVQNQGQKTAQSTGPQAPTTSVHIQYAKPPAGQAAPAQSNQGLADSMSLGPNQASQHTPGRAFSQPGVLQSGPPSPPPHPGTPGTPGTAPPQMPAVFPPPAMPSGMSPQHRYPFHPGTPLQPGVQHQPVPPHTMQPKPSQVPGGQYVMQQPQPAPPVKEEKGWFGRLWRSDSVRKQTSANQTSKQQKVPAQQQVTPMFPPPQLQPIQPTPAPQFAPQAAHVPPHFLVMQPGQQAQQVPIMQPQQQQQQQQQPLMWKANTGRDPYPRFPAPHRNPNQSFMPPPDVMQSIRKQDLRLQQPSHVQNPSRGQGQGQALPPLDAATHGGSSQGASEEVKVANDKTAVASAAVKSGHEEKASGWRKTNGGVSSSEYDGSGWGDEEEGQS